MLLITGFVRKRIQNKLKNVDKLEKKEVTDSPVTSVSREEYNSELQK
ncbi:MAG: hypothetical protein J7604_26680 [Sporocytophaga sp.]|nr:hypothetical protein [Sporocytophaga sp.]MBO9703821.1 hypothetical protein [Sporocytophaga sp.]